MAEKEAKRAVWSWCFYDWASSAFTTLILTFVYGAYFSQSVAPDPVQGASSWGYAISLSGLFVLFLAPVCGAFADRTGRLKIWIFLSSLLCVSGTGLMIFAVPQSSPGTIVLVLCGLVLANTGFELAGVFYNALLPSVAKPGTFGKVSSLAWSVGYAGGLSSLVLMLLCFIGVGGVGPFIDLPKDQAWHIRAAVPVAVLWFLLFALPLFLFVPDRPKTAQPLAAAFSQSGQALLRGFARLKADRTWRNFLIGSALYRDGLNTLFALGGIYAAEKYGLPISGILLFGIGMNVTAGLGAAAASCLEDRLGSFRVVRISLAGLLATGACILFADTKILFFAAALSLGFFVGPVQSASRTLVARLSKPDALAENYGFYALTGRAAAFFGPFIYALATGLFHTQNAGMVSIWLFWAAGFAFVYKLKDGP